MKTEEYGANLHTLISYLVFCLFPLRSIPWLTEALSISETQPFNQNGPCSL